MSWLVRTTGLGSGTFSSTNMSAVLLGVSIAAWSSGFFCNVRTRPTDPEEPRDCVCLLHFVSETPWRRLLASQANHTRQSVRDIPITL